MILSTIVFAPVVVVASWITYIVLIRSRVPRRVAAASLGFGLSGALLFALCFLLWGIGGIPFRKLAAEWAIGLNVVNLAVGIAVIRRLRGPRLSPSQRDVAPPGEPDPG
jgi:hypothetical protein